MMNLQNKMAVKVTKKVKYATALYHKIMPQGVATFYMKSFRHTFWTMPPYYWVIYRKYLIPGYQNQYHFIFANTKIP